jgi:hypothetical protein
VCVRERDFYGVVWLEGCKIRANQSSFKLRLQNKVVTIGTIKLYECLFEA